MLDVYTNKEALAWTNTCTATSEPTERTPAAAPVDAAADKLIAFSLIHVAIATRTVGAVRTCGASLNCSD